jgi:Zn-finger nucleic acid-binding protein
MVEGLIPMLSLSKSKGMIMKCPTCTDTPLVMAERQGVEIDYCPACRGIWLDRGELDKLLDRAAAAAPVAAAPAQQTPQSAPGMQRPQGYGDARYGHGDRDRDHYKRKKSWLHEIFD